MILKIANDMKYFLIMLGIVLIGFAESFWIMSLGDHTKPFGTASKAFLSIFDFMLGNSDSDFSGTSSQFLGTLLYVVFMVIVALLLLNLLIALMGESFGKVSEKGPAQFRYEQAKVILESECVNWQKEDPPKTLHILIRATEISEGEMEDASGDDKHDELIEKLREIIDACKHSQNVALAAKRSVELLEDKLDAVLKQVTNKNDDDNYKSASDVDIDVEGVEE
jgi:hypothetical protein